ncbi:glycosyltransferase family 4 protein [bacterium]|nr:glycosyltransferase family 4 protein [candidate division CSSED10-310 bacterium]
MTADSLLKTKPVKVWLLTNMPSPYQVELFNEIHHQDLIDLSVRFMRWSYKEPVSIAPSNMHFNYKVMPALGLRTGKDEFRIHLSILKEIKSSSHDVYILSGLYTSPTFLLSARRLEQLKKCWTMWLEQPWPNEYHPQWATKLSAKSSLVRNLRKSLLKWLIKNSSGLICIGTAAKLAYQSFGMKPENCFIMPYHCDIARYQSVDLSETMSLKDRFDLHGKTTYLYSGLLSERKGVDILIDSFNRLTMDNPNTALILLGDGHLRDFLQAAVNENCRDRVHFAGHVHQDNLPVYYSASDVFVFPSRHDGWAVVINEACAAGLPVIATRQTGAALDLVRDAYNGFLMDRDDAETCLKHMRFFAENNASIRSFGDRSREIIREYSLEAGARKLYHILQLIRDVKGG